MSKAQRIGILLTIGFVLIGAVGYAFWPRFLPITRTTPTFGTRDCLGELVKFTTTGNDRSSAFEFLPFVVGSAITNIEIAEGGLRHLQYFDDPQQEEQNKNVFRAQLRLEGLDPDKEVVEYFTKYDCRGPSTQRYPATGQPQFYMRITGEFRAL